MNSWLIRSRIGLLGSCRISRRRSLGMSVLDDWDILNIRVMLL